MIIVVTVLVAGHHASVSSIRAEFPFPNDQSPGRGLGDNRRHDVGAQLLIAADILRTVTMDLRWNLSSWAC